MINPEIPSGARGISLSGLGPDLTRSRDLAPAKIRIPKFLSGIISGLPTGLPIPSSGLETLVKTFFNESYQGRHFRFYQGGIASSLRYDSLRSDNFEYRLLLEHTDTVKMQQIPYI